MRDVCKHTNNSKVLTEQRLDRTITTRMPLGHVRFEDGQKYVEIKQLLIRLFKKKRVEIS